MLPGDCFGRAGLQHELVWVLGEFLDRVTYRTATARRIASMRDRTASVRGGPAGSGPARRRGSAAPPLADGYADLSRPQDVGAGPSGQRVNIAVDGGELTGERLKAPSGGGRRLAPDGLGRLCAQYVGLLELPPGTTAVLEGGETPTNAGDQYFVTGPRLATGDERCSWVNQTMSVGEGRLIPGRVGYRVHRAANA
ncbi:MAG: hypothetical protein JWQ45_3500 [Blastococcus sp.]|nr:hypothetical protein [Blastococcus sp.]